MNITIIGGGNIGTLIAAQLIAKKKILPQENNLLKIYQRNI